MYTNLEKHGGDFRNVLDKEFSSAKNVTIASGYASLDIIHAYEKAFLNITNKGGVSKLLLGMAFYEGLSQKKLDAVTTLNNELKMSSYFVVKWDRLSSAFSHHLTYLNEMKF